MRRSYFLIILLVCACIAPSLYAQNVGIGTTNPDASAVLDLTSTSMGFLTPRVTAAQMNSISSPSNGLLVFNTTANGFYFNVGTAAAPSWIPFASSASGWALTGNSSTTPGTNFLGTSDAQALVFKTNATERMRILSTGAIGIGTIAPTEALDITGNLRFSGALMPNNAARTSGYLLQSAGASTAPTWIDPNATLWKMAGNSSTTPGTNYLGTTDAQALVIKTNAIERIRITSTGAVGVGTNAPAASALVEFSSTSLGVLVPRMTSTQLAAIAAPGTGLLVFQTDSTTVSTPAGFYFYTGSTWIPLLTLQSGWGLNGNAGTNPTNNYIGTSDNTSLAVRTNNTERVRVLSTGEVGIGTTTPATKLEVKNGDIALTNSSTAGAVRFYEPSASGTNYTSIKARAQAADLSYNLPDTAGQAGNLLANDGSGNLYWTSNITIGALNLGVSTTVTYSGDQNNAAYSNNASVVRIQTASSINITGFAGGTDGRVVIFVNISGSNVSLKDEDAGSSAANRLTLGSASKVLNSGQSISMVYDGVSSRWRPFASYP